MYMGNCILGTIIGIVAVLVVFKVANLQALVPFLLLFVSFMFYNQGNFIARGFRKLAVYTIANILYLVCMAVFVTLFVFVLDYGLTGILLGNAVGHFAGFIYMFLATKLWKYISFEKPEWGEMKRAVSYSIPLIPNSISWWIVNVSDRSIINMVLGAASNGIYAIAYKLPSLVTVFGVYFMSWLENAVDTLNDEDRNSYTNGVFNKILPFCFCAASCVLSVNRYFYLWIWDAEYSDGQLYVWILLAGMCFSFLAQFLGGILVAEKRTKENGVTTVVAAIANIIIRISLIKLVGLYAAAISTCLSYVILFVVRIVLLRNHYHLSLKKESGLSICLFMITVFVQRMNNHVVGVCTILFAVIASVVINWSIVVDIFSKLLRRSK